MEPLISSEMPSEAWEILGTDLFELKRRSFIILLDSYSRYPTVKGLQAPVTPVTVTEVIG